MRRRGWGQAQWWRRLLGSVTVVALLGAPGAGASTERSGASGRESVPGSPAFADGEWVGNLIGGTQATLDGGGGSSYGAGLFMLTVEGGTIVAGAVDVSVAVGFSVPPASTEGTITGSGTMSGAADAPLVEISGRFRGTVTVPGQTISVDQPIAPSALFLTILSATCSVVIGTLEPDARAVLEASGFNVSYLTSQWIATRTRASGRERAEDFGDRVVGLMVERDQIMADAADGTFDADRIIGLLRRAERIEVGIPRAGRCSATDVDAFLGAGALVVRDLLELIAGNPDLFGAAELMAAIEAAVRTGLAADPDTAELMDQLRDVVRALIDRAIREGDSVALGLLGHAASIMGWSDEAAAAADALTGAPEDGG
ncbi:MAG: hypothetical protein FJW86_03845 [Actinobacteria bacterium]|nr:hypothetical protein [Actinomycetota bacterium]